MEITIDIPMADIVETIASNDSFIEHLYTELARETVDYSDLSDHLNYGSLAEEIDISDLASECQDGLADEISYSKLAEEVDLEEFAGSFDAAEIAGHVVDLIADDIVHGIMDNDEFKYAVSQIVREQLDAKIVRPRWFVRWMFH